jgi:uncharacterized protein (DUF1501 family)
MKRKDFIKYTSLASTAMLIPRFMKGFEKLGSPNLGPAEKAFGASGNRKVLVVVQLSGGNDGLNTIIPYRNDIYHKLRPQIGKSETEILKLNDDLAFNPVMDKLKGIYDDGKMSIINSVGYPNPDRSHFRSMDIWHSASDADKYLQTGWLGRYLDSNCPGAGHPYSAIETDSALSLALKGSKTNGIALESPEAYYALATEKYFKAVSALGNTTAHPEDDNLHYLYKTLAETGSSADYIYKTSRIYKSALEYPQGEFGRNLKTIADLIVSGLDTSVYYISLTGFDTHDQQIARQDRLLKDLSDGLGVFTDDLKANNRMNDVVIMTFSEFGRRVGENASKGTDHGTANNMMIINGNLKKPGIYNEAPDLASLDNGDLIYKIDFRQVYSETLTNWLGADANAILGKKYEGLGIV